MLNPLWSFIKRIKDGFRDPGQNWVVDVSIGADFP
jgi:hypothetical protein